MLPPTQIPQIKKQILEQIKKTFPLDKQAPAIKQLETMSDELDDNLTVPIASGFIGQMLLFLI